MSTTQKTADGRRITNLPATLLRPGLGLLALVLGVLALPGTVQAQAPFITYITPNHGALAGGTNVTIKGSFFTGTTSVTFGGIPATAVTVVDDSTITCLTPPGAAATVDVTVTTPVLPPDTLPSAFTYANTVSITSLTPAYGPRTGGTTVTIYGAGFVAGSTQVTFGVNPPVAATVVSSTELSCTTPANAAGAGFVDVTATVAGDTSLPLINGFQYQSLVTVQSITPPSGPLAGGTAVTIIGTGFAAGTTRVSFGGNSATLVTVVSATQLTCTTPAGAATGAVDVMVNNNGETGTKTAGFTYGAPTIVQITPSDGPVDGGTLVMISGTGFVAGQTTVTFGGQTATNIVVTSATSLTCTTPAHVAGTAGVVVIVNGVPSNSVPYLYNPSNFLRIYSISPGWGPKNGGTVITIKGSGFVAGRTAVAIGTDPGTGTKTSRYCSFVNVISTTELTAVTPPDVGEEGDIWVRVDGLPDSNTLQNAFMYTDTMLQIYSVTPNMGYIGGGETVTIAGQGFASGQTRVRFDYAGTNELATNVVVNNDGTSLTCVIPAHAAGLFGLQVDVNGITVNLDNAFTYTSTRGGYYDSLPKGPGDYSADGTVGFNDVVALSAAWASTPLNPNWNRNCDPTNVGCVGFNALVILAQNWGNAYAISPKSGPVAGGTNVVITGAGFIAGQTTVTFGTKSAANVSVAPDGKSLTCTTPANLAVGPVDVVVKVNGQDKVYAVFTCQ